MEKMLVIAGIWTMCALCAVFFMRGATAPDERRMTLKRAARAQVADTAGQ
ncbi:hypothetical protein [Paraburkholderia unamae]|jgi:hypothetical protein|uniref:Uncharacterized protein n=1 Tax=Paraburkholderia unamae TaxID=219649 RepID=A0ABX5KV45_9BURK|nr:hypothetical protein [Paraburkholderia unamae]PVX97452.1 hypothetical protein C7402_101163 [Paraburkholderia unamae]RAR66739.1 hypothetical protein C7401_102164 [Paraburkholderia unamae]CAG9274032.1 conserved hypothetical protein [Paraburkholderia unamae]